jgi:predicted AlkP superfamily phosphohydrolase/phosphomutase
MTRLVVIGIDGMDPLVFKKIHSEMPYFSSIAKLGDFKSCGSVFPPDSIPAWVTIFTGEYPENHGWLDNLDYEDLRQGVQVNKYCDLQGKTFWDILGQAGKRVCIINPLMAYPVWPVNGIMTNGPVFITGEKQIYPAELASRYELPELGGMTEFPEENELNQFLESTLQSTRNLAQFGLDLFDSEKWDLYFISFFTLDRIQHFLWRFSDPSDPLYPGHSSLENAITKAYKTFDDIVGEYLKRIDDHTGLIVLSDHGHGQRPTMLFNVNEVLRQTGLLKLPTGPKTGRSLKKGVEIAKNASIKYIVKIFGERWLYRFGRIIPKSTRKALKKSSFLIDKENSIAWASDMGGGASVGGIIINPQLINLSQDYENITKKVISILENIHFERNQPVVQWAKKRTQNSFYPDIIFELSPHFSVGHSLFSPILEKSPRHRIISGGHKKDGVLFVHHSEKLAQSISSIADIFRAVASCVLSD